MSLPCTKCGVVGHFAIDHSWNPELRRKDLEEKKMLIAWHTQEAVSGKNVKIFATNVVAFGIKDDKHREIGCQAYVTQTEDAFLVKTYAMRAGRQFGASFPKPTSLPLAVGLEGAKEFASKKIAAAKKRAIKNFASVDNGKKDVG